MEPKEEEGKLSGTKDLAENREIAETGNKDTKDTSGNRVYSDGFVDIEGGLGSKNPTPANTAADATSERNRSRSGGNCAHPQFGIPLHCKARGNFPAVGSQLGDYFCLGKLGKGTFSSIHKCVNLEHFHHFSSGGDNRKRPRIAAAKVEMSKFTNSGVLDSEAMIIDYLDRSLTKGTVPVYMGYYKSGQCAAIVMEYLPGEDMHHFREQVMAGSSSRRISLEDAVYLTADVMLPLLKEMHDVGIVHRDVKPSNCVRSSADEKKCFCIVDFGLSKNIVVTRESPFADKAHEWQGKDWLKPPNYTGSACYRKERESADFRGTSMYASLRVHQSKDYSPRDDIWSLLYVFCDLVSGGLPWMSYAANRNRKMCGKIKERVHGGKDGSSDQTEELLKGDEYHVAMHKREQQQAAGETSRLGSPPKPLAMSKDKKKVELLRTAFQHVAGLEYWDKPNYDLIQKCIRGFSETSNEDPPVKPIVWDKANGKRKKRNSSLLRRRDGHNWDLTDQPDTLEEGIFDDAENEMDAESKPDRGHFRNRLPLEVRFQLSQMEYNGKRPEQVPVQIALRDWMKVVQFLLYEDWDVRMYEEAHRTLTDGFRRDNYLSLLKECQKCAKTFNQFRSRECFYHCDVNSSESHDREATDESKTKRRKISATSSGASESEFVNVSRALFGLEVALKAERAKKPPPPSRISFGV